MATGGSGTGSGSDGDDESGEDDPSSSSLYSSCIMTPLSDLTIQDQPDKPSDDTDTLLAEFVKEWREELNQNTIPTTSSNNNNYKSSDNLALSYYKQGMLAENKQELSEAIKFYQSAYKIDPNIDEKIAQTFKNDDSCKNTITSNNVKLCYNEDMAPNIAKSITEVNWCIPNKPSHLTHISTLPLVVMIYILRFVVSSNLDIHLLSGISYTCKGFYLLTRSFTIWKKSCLIMWPAMNTIPMSLPNTYISWRHYYLTTLHLNFHGLYISKVIYTRNGGYSIDLSFCSRLTVTYYRYMRFFTDGQVFVYMTAEEPGTVVKKLTSKETNLINLTYGEYKLVNNIIQVKSKEKQGRYDVIKKCCFKIKRAKNNMRTYLKWQSYNLIQCKRNSSMVSHVNDFNVKNDSYFNNFYFSQVKSFLKSPKSIL